MVVSGNNVLGNNALGSVQISVDNPGIPHWKRGFSLGFWDLVCWDSCMTAATSMLPEERNLILFCTPTSDTVTNEFFLKTNSDIRIAY